MVGANLLDAESTVQFMRRGIPEGNPLWFGLLGEPPGNRARVYLVTAVPVALGVILTAELERRRLWWWWIPNAASTALHTYAGVHNYRMLKRTGPPTPLFTITVRF